MIQTILGYLATALVSAIVGWLSKVVHSWLQDRKTESEAKESVQPLKNAKTGEEIDKATDSALGGF